MTPASGPLAGGTTVVVRGEGLDSVQFVLVGNALATGVTVVSPTELRFVSPSSSVVGATSVTVNALTRGRTTAPGAFTYLTAPAVTAVAPTNGPLAGGTAITITGTNFESVSGVTVGSSAATAVEVLSTSQIRCITPAGTAAGPVNVRVTSSSRGSGTGANLFTYNPVPVVQTVTPASGLVTGGTSITVTGSGFVAGMSVTIGDAPATNVNVTSATEFTCLTPAGSAGPANLSVTVASSGTVIATGAFTYLGLATITAVTPLIGFNGGGTQLSITGQNLTGASVTLDGVACTGVIATATSISAITPGNAGGPPPRSVSIAVSTPNNGGATFGTQFTYQPDMNITSLTPANGPLLVPIPVTISGSNFPSSPAPTVRFGTITATNVVVVDATTITCMSPPGLAAGPVSVTLIHPSRGSNSSTYTYNGVPTAGISPNQGPFVGGTPITITGSGFGGTVNVTIGGNPCPPPIVVNGAQTTITCVTPAGTIGNQPVIVGSSTNGTVSISGGFTYNPLATITMVTPLVGFNGGGTQLTITGQNLTGASVTLDGVDCTGEIATATLVIATTPPNAGGPPPRAVTVAVSTPNNGSATFATPFTYQPDMNITSLTPANGPLFVPIPVTISGSNFPSSPVPTVRFGSIAATNVVVVNATTITCMSPPGLAAGPVSVTLVHPDQGSNSQTYTYNPLPTAAISPNQGPFAGATAITITGTNFGGTVNVTIGGTACPPPIVVNGPQTVITCVTPAGTIGNQPVVVGSSTNGTVTATGGFTYNPRPTVTACLPAAGTSTGGTVIDIGGTGFAPSMNVTLGTIPATLLSVTGTTTATCRTNAGPLGAQTILVESSTHGVSLAGATTYTYRPPAVISGALPATEVYDGGAAIEIFGTDFDAVPTPTVLFGGVPATVTGVTAPTTIRCIAPGTALLPLPQTVTLAVSSTTMGLGTLPAGFTYTGPVVNTVSPVDGPTTGGTILTIGGKGFSGVTGVTVDGIPCLNVSTTGTTTVTATTPGGTLGSKTVSVDTATFGSGTRTNAFTYYQAATITGVLPNSDVFVGGQIVEVFGADFRAIPTPTVMFGGEAATVTSVTAPTTIRCVVPATTLTPLPQTVTMAVSSTTMGLGTLPAGFTYTGPAVNTVSPVDGPTTGGTIITIGGKGFVGVTGVTVDGNPCTNLSTTGTTTVTATTPGGTIGSKTVVVDTATVGSGTGTNAFTYYQAATVTGVLPASGAFTGGQTVEVFGADIRASPVPSVRFGPNAATVLSVTAPTTIRCVVPASTATPLNSTVDVTISSTSMGVGVGTNAYAYTGPQISAVSPGSGPASGGTVVLITGEGFAGVTGVTVDGVSCTGVVVPDTTRITATTPAGAVGFRDVRVDTSGAGFTTLVGGFEYYPSVSLLTINPTSSSFVGNVTVDIGGLNITSSPTPTVLVDSQPATVTAITGTTTITAIVPPTTRAINTLPATVVVTVTSPAIGTDEIGFTYRPPFISALTPGAGPITGGTPITITGEGFAGVTAVLVDGRPIGSLAVSADLTTITGNVSIGNVLGPAPVRINSSVFGFLQDPAFQFTFNPAFAAPITLGVGSGPEDLAIADFNGDGRKDIAICNLTGGGVAIARSTIDPMSGALSFSLAPGPPISPSQFFAGSLPKAVAVADMDRDGFLDVVTANQTGFVAILSNGTPRAGLGTPGGFELGAVTSDPTLRQPAFFFVGTSLRSIALADYNLDGATDVAGTGVNTNELFVATNAAAPGALGLNVSNVTPSAGVAPIAITAGDLNNDGKTDIALVNRDSLDNQLAVFMNISAPGGPNADFNPPITFTVDVSPTSVELGDINGDGFLDVITGCGTVAGSTSVSTLINKTLPGTLNVSFSTLGTGGSRSFPVGERPIGSALVDMNADGRPDIVSVADVLQAFSFRLNLTDPAFGADADPVFGNNSELPLGTGPTALAVEDLDGDGRKDLVTCDQGSNTISIFLNQTPLGTLPAAFTENPTRTVVAAGPVALDVADLNGDGLPDVAVTASTAAQLSTFTNSTTPGSISFTFNATANFATAPFPRGLALGDATFDGRPDALVGSFDPFVELFRLFPNSTPLGTADPTFDPPIVDPGFGGAPVNTAIGDLNSDGMPDLAIADPDPSAAGILLYRNNGPPATFSFSNFLGVSPGPVSGLTLADMNGDGKPEIIATDENADVVSIFENTSSPGGALSFGYVPPPGFIGRAFPLQRTTGRRPVAVAAKDINGDGKRDLVVANRDDGSVTVILNATVDVTLTFGSRVDVAAGAGTNGLDVVDVNRDGIADVVAANRGANTVSVLLNRTPTLATSAVFPGVAGVTRTTLSAGSAPADVKVRDMNGDGLPDLVVPNTVDGTVSIFRNDTP